MALLAAAAVQFNWATATSAWGTADWWPWVAAVLVTATAWLLAAAWLHWRLAHSPNEDPIERLTRLGMNGVSDLLVALLAAVSLFRGPESRVLLAGLSLVPPALMAVAAASIVALAIGMLEAWRRRDSAASGSDSLPRARDRWRTAVVVALFVSIGMLSTQPLPAN
jgi:hypothetical protein